LNFGGLARRRKADDHVISAEYDFDGLTAVMLTLITGQAR
jgi:hypothetical protein